MPKQDHPTSDRLAAKVLGYDPFIRGDKARKALFTPIILTRRERLKQAFWTASYRVQSAWSHLRHGTCEELDSFYGLGPR